MFDEVEIIACAGRGGDGAISFRREKYVPFGGPDGGDGGGGGDVVIIADADVDDLRTYKRRRIFKAGDGMNGMGKKKHGKKGRESVVSVPVGTLVQDKNRVDDEVIADLEQDGQRVVVAGGGKGGLGNIHFASSTNQVPRIAEAGEVGEERVIILEMRMIADVGIIGYPNVGKSTLLATVSAANPKIANYPFTTLEPILGLVEVGQQSLTLAEIPGLVDDAHTGRGLGYDFLRHIMRTKILIHLIDGCSESLVDNMVRVNRELSLFAPALAVKPQLVAVNKIDLPQVQVRSAQIKGDFKSVGTEIMFVSAKTGEGVTELMTEAMKMLNEARETVRVVPQKVFRPEPRADKVRVSREGDTFVVAAPGLERIIARTDMSSPEMRGQLNRQLSRSGVRRALEKAGVAPGDKVRCGGLEWEW